MKVVAVMEVSPTDGGGFYQAVNAVLQMQRLCQGRYAFSVAVANAESLEVLQAIGIVAFHLPTTLYERLQPMLPPSRIARRLLRSVSDPVDLERRLVAVGADLVYFVAQWGPHRLKKLCYWATVWDLAHLEFPEFPEVSKQFQIRERMLQRSLAPAHLVVADSHQLCQRICQRYAVAPERVLAMPFAPGLAAAATDSRPRDEVLQRHGLEPGYFFYPAQFWAHKNHLRILEALERCAALGHRLRVVFAGGDAGIRAHVEAATRAKTLQPQVRFLGFVDARDMRGLYQCSRALVMPSYFGPTNLPPLEAWSLGVPVIYSKHLNEQAGDAALLADADDPDALAEQMMACLDDTLCADLVARGSVRLQAIDEQRRLAESVMVDRLKRLEARLRCSA